MPKKWEYKIVKLLYDGSLDTVEKKLNELGKEGWELMAVTDTEWAVRAYFKKEKSQ